MAVQRFLILSATLGAFLVSAAVSSADVRVLSVGDEVPDCELVSEQGTAFHLRDLRGQAVAVTFIFTRCPLANYCPLMSSHFRAVQSELTKESTGKQKWHLLSLSFDPEHDTPDRLLAYGKAHKADEARWSFATGKPGAVAHFGANFGLTAYLDGGFLNHNLRTVVIDPAGKVQHVFKGNEWKAEDLVWEIRKVMTD